MRPAAPFAMSPQPARPPPTPSDLCSRPHQRGRTRKRARRGALPLAAAAGTDSRRDRLRQRSRQA